MEPPVSLASEPPPIEYRRANRQYVAMSEDEVWAFLDQQRVLFVAFTGEDGYPHVTPVWFVVDGRRIYFRATSNKVKARLADGALVAAATESGERFTELRGVLLRGRSRLVAEPELLDRYDELKAGKYAGLTSADLAMPAAWTAATRGEPHVHVEITPERISSWDNTRLDAWTG